MWVEIGVYPGPAKKWEDRQVILGTQMYLIKHLVTRASETITLELPRELGHVGVDPRSLLIHVRPRANFVDVLGSGGPARR